MKISVVLALAVAGVVGVPEMSAEALSVSEAVASEHVGHANKTEHVTSLRILGDEMVVLGEEEQLNWRLVVPHGAQAAWDEAAGGWHISSDDGDDWGFLKAPFSVRLGLSLDSELNLNDGTLTAAVDSRLQPGDMVAVGYIGGTESYRDVSVTGWTGIPHDYVYDPHSGNADYRALHDYCTLSPDQWTYSGTTVSFRGPCARHDMCYEHHNPSSMWKRKHRRNKHCQKPFLHQLKGNCDYKLGSRTGPRRSCKIDANVYYGAVKSANWASS